MDLDNKMKTEIQLILKQSAQPLCLLFVALFLCLFSTKPELNKLEQLLNDGTLRVASRIGPLSYYEREGEPNGLDYNLLVALSQYLGVELEVTIYDNIKTQLNSVYLENQHLSASTLTKTNDRAKMYTFSEPYMEVSAIMVQHSSRSFISDISEIMQEDYSLVAIENSSHSEILNQIKAETHPQLAWEEESDTIMFELMEQVQTKQIDYAVVDSSIFQMERSMFPRLEIAMDLSSPQSIGLVLPISKDDSLLNAVNSFLSDYKETGQLGLLQDAYFLDQDSMDIAGALLFKERLKSRLPDYEEMFRETAKTHNYDWLLLAAQAYQESHWNAEARSPTGVRGLMMLTLPTARQLGIDNRLDPEQSLKGGIEYLLSLHSRIPERIIEPDKTKFALAAYNVGFGHLEDARILTERAGKSPDIWEDVQEFLPLLRQKKYYSTVKRGYARGNEPVSYVNNIYRFKSILDWYSWQQELIETKRIAEQKVLPENQLELIESEHGTRNESEEESENNHERDTEKNTDTPASTANVTIEDSNEESKRTDTIESQEHIERDVQNVDPDEDIVQEQS